MSGISTNSARMEAGKSNQPGTERPWFDLSTSHVGGFCAAVKFYPKWNFVLIIKHKTNPNYMQLVSIPAPNWEGDLMNEFEDYEIVQRFYEVADVKVR